MRYVLTTIFALMFLGTCWSQSGIGGGQSTLGGGGGTTFPTLAPNGSAAAPSYSFTAGSGNAGMYHTNSLLAFSQAGTEVGEFNSSNSTTTFLQPNVSFSGTGTLSFGQKANSYNNVSLAGSGLVAVYATVAHTALVANETDTLIASATAGDYRVCAGARTTTSGTGTTATMNIIWTDEGGAKTDAVGTFALNSVTVTGQINKCEFLHAAAASAIQCSTSGGTYGTSVYAFSCTVEQLQ